MPAASSLVAPSLARRMAAWLYEALLLFAIALVATLVFSIATQMRHALAGRQWLFLFVAVVWGFYFTWSWSRGQTLPMKTWRLALVDSQGRALSRQRALLRYLMCSLWVAPPVLVFAAHPVTAWQPVAAVFAGWVLLWALLSLLHPQRQFWHDAWAGTRVVEMAQHPVLGRHT